FRTSLGGRQSSTIHEAETVPKVEDGIGPDKAVRDWRFGRLRIESFDSCMIGEKTARMAGFQEAGEDSPATTTTAAAAAAAAATPAASLGPNLGGMGLATKARYVPLETKNTEAGWG